MKLINNGKISYKSEHFQTRPTRGGMDITMDGWMMDPKPLTKAQHKESSRFQYLPEKRCARAQVQILSPTNDSFKMHS